MKRAWACVSRHDFNGLLDLLAPDVTWEIPSMPGCSICRAPGGVGKACLSFSRLWPRPRKLFEFAPEAFIAEGQTVVVLGNFADRVNGPGKTARSALAQVWTAKAGKLASMQEYVDTLAVNSAYLAQQELIDRDTISGTRSIGAKRRTSFERCAATVSPDALSCVARRGTLGQRG